MIILEQTFKKLLLSITEQDKQYDLKRTPEK